MCSRYGAAFTLAPSFVTIMADVSVYVTSALTLSERRILPQWELGYLKQRLELITGVAAEDQQLQYFPEVDSQEHQTWIGDDATTLALFDIKPYSRIHVVDTNPDLEAAQLNEAATNVDNVSYEMTDEEYARRGDTVLEWKKKHQLGRFDPKFDEEAARRNEENIAKALTMKAGDRCRVINIEGERRGTIRYVGRIEILDEGKSMWVGIEFDEPVGKNDGLINGTRVFETRPKHGGFVKPSVVEVGDFPELDPFADSDEEL